MVDGAGHDEASNGFVPTRPSMVASWPPWRRQNQRSASAVFA